MGRASRPKPERLAMKLVQIRTALNLSQNGMIRKMGLIDELLREEVSLFEHGVRVPPLPVLLEYARVANVYVDALIDDNADLPEPLPPRVKSDGVKKRRAAKATSNVLSRAASKRKK
jgi:transcriptional regulator with XRE-family HTH domain